MEAHPLIARLRQHVVPPQPPQLFLGFTPQTPLKGGVLALCFLSQQSTTDGLVSGCGSSRPVPAARRKARVPNKQPGPRALSGLLEVLTPTRRGRAGQGRAGPWNSPPWYPPRPPKKAQTTLQVNSGAFTLPHRSDGTLGRGPRSQPRAPMQMVSGALGSLGLRV